MLLLIHAFCLILSIPQSFCYIFDVKYSYTFNVNRTGYLTTFLQTDVDGFRLMAGIPREDRLLLCNHTSSSTCQSFSPKEKNPAGYELLGAAIDGGSNPNDPIYVCSPRHIVLPQYRANGRCFVFEKGSFTQIDSLDNAYLQVQVFNNTPEFFYAHGQAGFSVKYIDKTEFVLGAPGVLSWKGTIVKHTDHEDKQVLYPEKIIEKNSYLGYSVEYGNFYFAGKRIRCVITGAPRDDVLIGQVYIFDYESDRNYPIKVLRSDQMSSFYGHSLLVTSNELLVGAPMYKTKAFEEGCVFVYVNNMQDFSLFDKVCGNQMGGRFGTAMTEIGFIGTNKHLGIAISAPFADDGVGIVYIYVKIDEGYKEIQRIMGKSVSDTIKGFGFSLSNTIDADQNNYNDFAVGSLVTDLLIILRSRKILHFTAYTNSYVDKISTDTKNISLSYCFQYTGHSKDIDQISTNILVESDDRVAVINWNRTIEVRIGANICEDLILALTPPAFDSPLPLNVKITNKLAECIECPVVYPKNTVVTHEIPFVTGCGEDNVCTPNLMLKAYIEEISTLVLGNHSTVTLTVWVSNYGETAYLTKMNVTLPTQISQFPAACSKVEDMLHCDISNRLVFNQSKQLQFLFDVKHLEAHLNELEIDVAVGSAGSGDGRFAMSTVRLPITLEASVTLIGSNLEYLENKEIANFTHEYTVFNNGPSPLIGERFKFQIPESISTSNGGVIFPFIIYPLADECIPVDEGVARKRRNTAALEHILPDVPHYMKYHIGCKSNEFVNCKTYHCIIGELSAGASLKFRFKLEVKTSLIFEGLGNQIDGKSIFAIQSVASIFNNSEAQEAFSHTILTRLQIGIPNMWIWILVAVVGSLIILLIIIGILYKLNFFARPMREKLLTEEEQKQERECFIVNDDKNDTIDAGVFNDIQFQSIDTAM